MRYAIHLPNSLAVGVPVLRIFESAGPEHEYSFFVFLVHTCTHVAIIAEPPLKRNSLVAVQVLEQVQGQHAKGKKLRILFDDGENIGSDDIMRAAHSGTRGAGVRTDPVVLHFFKHGELTYKQALTHGFYAPFGDFPEVAEKDELPPLTGLLERCSVLEGREVVLIDPQMDNELRAFLDGPVVEVASAAGEAHMVRVQRVAVLVATKLGGAMSDAALTAQYSTYSQSLQHTQGSTVLLLGTLSVRTPSHCSTVPLYFSAVPPHAVVYKRRACRSRGACCPVATLFRL